MFCFHKSSLNRLDIWFLAILSLKMARRDRFLSSYKHGMHLDKQLNQVFINYYDVFIEISNMLNYFCKCILTLLLVLMSWYEFKQPL